MQGRHGELDEALCNDPKVRVAWQVIKERAAQLGQGDSAYLPVITADYQGIRDNAATDVRDHPDLSSVNRAFVQTADVGANLVIWDFGSRAAASRAARELMLAATASYRASLQTAVADVSKDYYAALEAAGQGSVSKDAVEAARCPAVAAEARVTHGVAAISDQLQAETSLQEAEYASEKTASDLRATKGVLALDMGRDPIAPYMFPYITAAEISAEFCESSVRDLLEEADARDPTIASAVAQLHAAQAQFDEAKADGLPIISLTTKYARNNQPASLGLSIPSFREPDEIGILAYRSVSPCLRDSPGLIKSGKPRPKSPSRRSHLETMLGNR